LVFNPALDATTLDIANWTTKTDSIFDFQINQGPRTSYDMTLHMVAIDDLGDYDRTPARLHFFSNSLGNPVINFYRINNAVSPPDTVPLLSGTADTLGFGLPYHLYWDGSTPNIRGYDLDALAVVDTVYPHDDGLYGFKWRLSGALGGNCVPTQEDCWHPRRFNEATGDSFSYFGDVRSLYFNNDDSGETPFTALLPSGSVVVNINSIDVAGVEVNDFARKLEFLVNYDPQTRVLDYETDFAHPEDDQIYPYYILLNDPTQTRYPFHSGDRIPDRSYVVVKALARDDPRDLALDPNFKIGLTGFVAGDRTNFTGGNFGFTTQASPVDTLPTWDLGTDGWYADTLGFMTGPSTEFTYNMQAVDEHGRRDGSPATLSFHVGYPPCAQCVEVLPKNSATSDYDETVACADPDDVAHPCFADTAQYSVSYTGLGPDELEWETNVYLAINKATYFTSVVEDSTGLGTNNYIMVSRAYNMKVLLHGKDTDEESWDDPLYRALGWQYQVDYDCDPYNQIKDGGGADDLNQATWGEPGDGIGLSIDENTGLWALTVRVVVPDLFMQFGPEAYYNFILLPSPEYANGDPEVADLIFEQCGKQFGVGSVRAIALDQTLGSAEPYRRPSVYYTFKDVRPSVTEPPVGYHWRERFLSVPRIDISMSLTRGAMASSEGVPVTKYFRITAVGTGWTYECTNDD